MQWRPDGGLFARAYLEEAVVETREPFPVVSLDDLVGELGVGEATPSRIGLKA
jgi:hypothetical protein